jgi:DHA2 family multidrug resistance protein
MVKDEPALECRHYGLLVLAVVSVNLMQMLDVTIANVALPHMRAGLGATLDTISWALTSYIVTGVMVTPIVGWASDRFGSRNVFLVALAIFVLSSMLCGAATTLMQMVIFRAIQGACAGFIGPMTQTILFDVTRPSKQSVVISVFGSVVMVAPIVGPIVGGLITESWSWRWIFYVNVPLGIATFVMLVWLLPSRESVQRKLDRLGFVLFMVALVAFQLMLDRGEHQDWFSSWEILIELTIAGAAFWAYFFHTRTTRNPLFHSGLFADPNFLVSMGVMVVLGLANVALAAVLPTMFERVYGYPPIETGLLLAPRGVGVLVTMLLVSRLMKLVDIRYLLMTGYFISSAALLMTVGWSVNMDSWDIVFPGFIQGLGMGLIFTPINVAAFSTVPIAYRQDASSLLNLTRNLGSSFGISLSFTLLSRNAQINHSDLAGYVTQYSLPTVDPTALVDRFGDLSGGVMTMLNAEVSRQSLMIAYLNNFYLISILLFVIGLLPLMLKPIRIPAVG